MLYLHFVFVEGCFDAIERNYLEKVTLWFHDDKDRPEIAKEAYIFSFKYFEEKGMQYHDIRLFRFLEGESA